jgi:hypothetical protein
MAVKILLHKIYLRHNQQAAAAGSFIHAVAAVFGLRALSTGYHRQLPWRWHKSRCGLRYALPCRRWAFLIHRQDFANSSRCERTYHAGYLPAGAGMAIRSRGSRCHCCPKRQRRIRILVGLCRSGRRRGVLPAAAKYGLAPIACHLILIVAVGRKDISGVEHRVNQPAPRAAVRAKEYI